MLKKIFKDAVTYVYTKTEDGDPGSVRLSGGNGYRFVQNASGATWAVGDILSGATNDMTRGLAYQLGTAGTNLSETLGVAMSAVPSLGYGWLQISGVGQANIDGTVAVAALDPIIPSTSHNYGVKGTVVPTGGVIVARAAVGSAGVVLTNVYLHSFL